MLLVAVSSYHPTTHNHEMYLFNTFFSCEATGKTARNLSPEDRDSFLEPVWSSWTSYSSILWMKGLHGAKFCGFDTLGFGLSTFWTAGRVFNLPFLS